MLCKRLPLNLSAMVGLLLIVLSTSAQNNRDFKEPSLPAAPTTASLLEYAQIPVSKYTGVPAIKIPLYTIKSGSLTLPVNLSYHASGIKVQQEASWVGLGWALDAGGMISRSIRGREDFGSQGVGYWGAQHLPTSANGVWYSAAYPMASPNHNIIKGMLKGEFDAEPDLFFLNFAGFSGKFIFEKQTTINSIINGTCLDQSSNIRIQYRLLEKKFVVTDGNGNAILFRYT